MLKLEKKIGLAGGIGIVTGGVIGMGAYALIPGIASNAGSGAWLAILTALIISLISVLPLIQISSALPVAGAGYFYASRLLHPLAGVLASGWAIIGGCSSLSLISLALSDYILDFYPLGINAFQLSMLFVVLFYLVYQFGLKLLTTLQISMVVQMLISLIIYAIVMLANNDYEIVAGPPAAGFGIAVVLAFNVCFGFQIIIEMGEEMHNPKKNIPLSLIFGSIVIMIIYIAILSGYLSETGIEGAKLKPSLSETAQPYFNIFMHYFFLLGVMNAGITSFIAGAIALPREIYSMARDQTLPLFLTKISPKSGVPIYSVNLFFIMVLLLLGFGYLMDEMGVISHFFGSAKDNKIEFFGFSTIMGIMLLTIVICISAFRLPKLYPENFKTAYIQFPPWLLNTFIVISFCSSLALLLLISIEKWIIPAIYLLATFKLLLFFYFRKKYLKSKGLRIGEIFEPFKQGS